MEELQNPKFNTRLEALKADLVAFIQARSGITLKCNSRISPSMVILEFTDFPNTHKLFVLEVGVAPAAVLEEDQDDLIECLCQRALWEINS